jgi:hypothetical protein
VVKTAPETRFAAHHVLVGFGRTLERNTSLMGRTPVSKLN